MLEYWLIYIPEISQLPPQLKEYTPVSPPDTTEKNVILGNVREMITISLNSVTAAFTLNYEITFLSMLVNLIQD